MASRLQQAVADARASKDLRLMSDALTLFVECSILSGQLEEAEHAAKKAHEVRFFMGRFNNADAVRPDDGLGRARQGRRNIAGSARSSTWLEASGERQ